MTGVQTCALPIYKIDKRFIDPARDIGIQITDADRINILNGHSIIASEFETLPHTIISDRFYTNFIPLYLNLSNQQVEIPIDWLRTREAPNIFDLATSLVYGEFTTNRTEVVDLLNIYLDEFNAGAEEHGWKPITDAQAFADSFSGAAVQRALSHYEMRANAYRNDGDTRIPQNQLMYYMQCLIANAASSLEVIIENMSAAEVVTPVSDYYGGFSIGTREDVLNRYMDTLNEKLVEHRRMSSSRQESVFLSGRKLISFDLDGTLIDSYDIQRAGENAAISSLVEQLREVFFPLGFDIGSDESLREAYDGITESYRKFTPTGRNVDKRQRLHSLAIQCFTEFYQIGRAHV